MRPRSLSPLTETVLIRMTPEQRAAFNALGGAVWVRAMIVRHKDEIPPEQPKEPPVPAKINPYPPLESVENPTVGTHQAAYYLNRKAQTMRSWASCKEDAPIKPIRLYGRLAWPVAAIREVLQAKPKEVKE